MCVCVIDQLLFGDLSLPAWYSFSLSPTIIGQIQHLVPISKSQVTCPGPGQSVVPREPRTGWHTGPPYPWLCTECVYSEGGGDWQSTGLIVDTQECLQQPRKQPGVESGPVIIASAVTSVVGEPRASIDALVLLRQKTGPLCTS